MLLSLSFIGRFFVVWFKRFELTGSFFHGDPRPFEVSGLGINGGVVQGILREAVKAVMGLRPSDGDFLLPFAGCWG